MTRYDKQMLRLAAAIREQLKAQQPTAASVKLPTQTWQQCESFLRRMGRARQRGWHLAAERLRNDLRESLQRLHGELNATVIALGSSQNEPNAASIADIYADLVTLAQEFDEVAFDRQRRTISVTTEPIELEGVDLGPFEIRLDWDDLKDGHPNNYRVIALDANPATTNESVTHPHVQDESVCEGEGRQPIRRALQQGRLLDFFVIVANLLRTYNSGSPYVSLSDWHGVECSDCGATVNDGERWACEKCDTRICGECYQSCSDCDGIFCSECTTSCEACGERRCRSCISVCSACHGEFCKSCLDENEMCSDCQDKENEETESHDCQACHHTHLAV